MNVFNFLNLRQILALDAVASGATGLLLVAGAGVLESWLGIPAGFQRGVGTVLLAYAAFVGWLASRPQPPRGLVWTVIAINVAWVVESVFFLLGGGLAPTGLGIAFVLAQAAVVALFADLQYLALKREKTQAA